ncbi:GntR family transcriptional regulator [Erwinia sp. OLTSP20]|uniref:GntR family transcriptional regulator n=1 Tax=unclassified Erwinia TaxID=2622719 RepID=UPI000C19B211|nr:MULTISPECIES: GntR family transcriptional regulator [unclassified Erwinia]PIJ50142.1 GntR family transcriptional regulator [Erwinia sp. OAMSP11]PIJ71908.1 GntR family transcriptional regulator [Erwinia sp. OLSSP12]PIJ81110.1 GntR family transcriptional regulator [Erwinia sp. OLCASP19]PIJ83540.1 GntR family transcriptional regulator [Erwinia sp. OLMTSP26]PIJ86155.1 GntR family transcriptional regulator [Erwinia sp. OLMDSP33]
MKALREGRSLNETIYSRIRELILTGQLLPGSKLKIAELAQRFDVSLNVIREALSRLAGELLVEVAPQQGFSVRSLDADDLIDLTAQRIRFESIALRKSIESQNVEWQARLVAANHLLVHTPQTQADNPTRLNPEWHARHEDFNLIMMENCGSKWLFLMIKQLTEAFAIYQRVLLPVAPEEGERNTDHNQLLQAILNNHADLAITILSDHLNQTRDVMLRALQDVTHAGKQFSLSE